MFFLCQRKAKTSSSKKEVAEKVTPESSGATEKRGLESSESKPSKRARQESEFDGSDIATMADIDI